MRAVGPVVKTGNLHMCHYASSLITRCHCEIPSAQKPLTVPKKRVSDQKVFLFAATHPIPGSDRNKMSSLYPTKLTKLALFRCVFRSFSFLFP